ncbi:MAG: insulinase family protein, partial [bacterium]|nr:insulinase family protein [bacterium]
YITNENVTKEKGIILEEERMYEDNPDRVLNERSRANLFVNDPYGKKVVGEEEDIKNITKDDLITCYNSFYTSNNMFLIITGNFDKNDAINIVKNNFSKIKKSKSKIEKIKFEEPDQVKKEYEEIKLNVSTPRISLNYKINKKIFSLDDYNLGIYLSMILRLAFSDTSLFYEEGLEKKLFIDFSYFITITQTHIVITFNIISENDKALEKIEQELKNIKLNEKDFERMRACLIANEVKTVDNVSLMSYDIFDDVIYYGGYKNEKIKDLKNLTYKKMLDVKNKIDISNKAVVKIINNQ